MNDNENIIVNSHDDSRFFVKTYYDFLRSTLLSGMEKIVFIILKSYVNFKDYDSNKPNEIEKNPSLDTIALQCAVTKKTVIKILKSLETKGAIKVTRKGCMQNNVYTIIDMPGIWGASSIEELNDNIKKSKLELAREYLQEYGYEIKEKESASLPTKVKDVDPINYQYSDIRNLSTSDMDIITESVGTVNKKVQNKRKKIAQKSNVLNRYEPDKIREMYDFDSILSKNPVYEIVLNNILRTLTKYLNYNGETLRIDGVNYKTRVVIGKLMQLDEEIIMYVAEKFMKITEKIDNKPAYILTMLFNAEDQLRIDMLNQANVDSVNNPAQEHGNYNGINYDDFNDN